MTDSRENETEMEKLQRQRAEAERKRHAAAARRSQIQRKKLFAISDEEAARVRAILERSREDQVAEYRRKVAEIEIEDGKTINLEDTLVSPTPEQLQRSQYARVDVDVEYQRDQPVQTYQNVGESRILQLHWRGVIDDQQFIACRYYRERWEMGGLAGLPGVALYGEMSSGGDRYYGHMPKSEAAVAAREDYRWARKLISAKFVELFEAVVLHEATFGEAAKKVRCRKALAALRFKMAASELHMGILHLMPILMAGKKPY